MANFPNSEQQRSGMLDRMNAFWIEPAKRDVMGYRLTNVSDGDVIAQGTPLKCDDAEKTAEVCRFLYVIAVATDKKTLEVKSGHLLKSGDKVMISGAETPALLTISKVTDNQVVLSAANNTIAAGMILVEAAQNGSEITPVALPNRVAASKSTTITGTTTIAAAHSGIVLENVVHYPKEYINETTFPGSKLLVGCPTISFTIQ
ncbi:MAG: hypothetical protein NC083_08805 [Muribaculum sp.]|nr:hypothetical protein [Muribaculum sp.]MCM1577057.1 hypothetical protein [Bacteroides sp.]